nr:hypothetical protein [uncultured archaeon]
MKEERHIEILKEVLDEIEIALRDERGLVTHQRRLAFSLSLGVVNLIELYFHKLSIIKEGAKINHKWLKRKRETLFEHLQQQIISPIDSIENINSIVDIAIKIEEKRDDLAYGAPSTEKVIQEKINLFFELKGITRWKI